MSSFLFQIGRLGFARANYSAIGGWHKLWWRFWLRTSHLQLVEEGGRLIREEIARQSKVLPGQPMHWSPDTTGMPMCGAPLLPATLWTREFLYATCEHCKQKGIGLVLQHDVSTR